MPPARLKAATVDVLPLRAEAPARVSAKQCLPAYPAYGRPSGPATKRYHCVQGPMLLTASIPQGSADDASGGAEPRSES